MFWVWSYNSLAQLTSGTCIFLVGEKWSIGRRFSSGRDIFLFSLSLSLTRSDAHSLSALALLSFSSSRRRSFRSLHDDFSRCPPTPHINANFNSWWFFSGEKERGKIVFFFLQWTFFFSDLPNGYKEGRGEAKVRWRIYSTGYFFLFIWNFGSVSLFVVSIRIWGASNFGNNKDKMEILCRLCVEVLLRCLTVAYIAISISSPTDSLAWINNNDDILSSTSLDRTIPLFLFGFWHYSLALFHSVSVLYF